MKIINPATEALIREVKEDSDLSVRKKFERAQAAQCQWATVPISQRVEAMARFERLLDEETDRLAEVLTSEVGKPIRESHNELAGARHRIRYFVEHSEAVLEAGTVHEETGMVEYLEYEPLGVVGNISAWNYPYLVGVNVFVPALIGGNAVLYKPSEYATLTGLELGRLLHRAGIPKDIFQTLVGGPAIGKKLLRLPLDGYFFTGSYQTGRSIAEAVRSRLVPLGMELGGKDPLYVADDVLDISQVAKAVVEGCFYNNGQSCCAVERVYVQQKIYRQFLEAFLGEVKKLRVGDPLDPTVTQGPITRPRHRLLLEVQVRDAVAKGAKLLEGGHRWGKRGFFFEPTVLTRVNHKMRVMKEETFGPVIGIQSVRDDAQAVRLMNDTEYGLTAAVYSGSESRARAILKQIDAGTGYWNCCDRVSPNLPWSGRKHSGIGATLSTVGIQTFVRPKAYHLRGDHPLPSC